MSRTAALLLPLLAGCGPSEQVRVVVVGAEVRSECVDGGTCGWQEVSVGHCGPGVGVPQRAGAPARAVTDTPAKDVSAVVTVRHLAGDMPREAANGGNARGWLLGATARANVEALYRADVTLYSLDATGEPLAPRADWLVTRDGGLLALALRRRVHLGHRHRGGDGHPRVARHRQEQRAGGEARRFPCSLRTTPALEGGFPWSRRRSCGWPAARPS